MNYVYNNTDDYNFNRKRKNLIVFDDMMADIITNKKFQAIIKENLGYKPGKNNWFAKLIINIKKFVRKTARNMTLIFFDFLCKNHLYFQYLLKYNQNQEKL